MITWQMLKPIASETTCWLYTFHTFKLKLVMEDLKHYSKIRNKIRQCQCYNCYINISTGLAD